MEFLSAYVQVVITKIDSCYRKFVDIFCMLGKTTAAVGALRKKNRVGPEDENDAYNGGNSIQKYIY